MYVDKEMTCKECGQSFTFTAGEQEFYASKGFENEPSRCPSCRNAKKQQRNNGGVRRERQMYPAICNECGCETMVPFQPSGEKPVYCRECFQAKRERERV